MNVRNNHKLLGRVKAFDRHCNLYVPCLAPLFPRFASTRVRHVKQAASRCRSTHSVPPTLPDDAKPQPPIIQAAGKREGDVDGGAQVGQGQKGQAGTLMEDTAD